MTNVWKHTQKPEPRVRQRPTTNQNTQFTYNIHVFCSYYSIYSTQKSYRFYYSHHLKSHNWQRWTCPGIRWHWLVNGCFVAIQQTGDAMRRSRALRVPRVSSHSNLANRSPSSDWTTCPFRSAPEKSPNPKFGPMMTDGGRYCRTVVALGYHDWTALVGRPCWNFPPTHRCRLTSSQMPIWPTFCCITVNNRNLSPLNTTPQATTRISCGHFSRILWIWLCPMVLKRPPSI